MVANLKSSIQEIQRYKWIENRCSSTSSKAQGHGPLCVGPQHKAMDQHIPPLLPCRVKSLARACLPPDHRPTTPPCPSPPARPPELLELSKITGVAGEATPRHPPKIPPPQGQPPSSHPSRLVAAARPPSQSWSIARVTEMPSPLSSSLLTICHEWLAQVCHLLVIYRLGPPPSIIGHRRPTTDRTPSIGASPSRQTLATIPPRPFPLPSPPPWPELLSSTAEVAGGAAHRRHSWFSPPAQARRSCHPRTPSPPLMTRGPRPLPPTSRALSLPTVVLFVPKPSEKMPWLPSSRAPIHRRLLHHCATATHLIAVLHLCHHWHSCSMLPHCCCFTKHLLSSSPIIGELH